MIDETKAVKLTDPFPFVDVDYRIGASSDGGEKGVRGMLVFYITARAVMDRLDACGCAWWDEYTLHPDGKHVECRLTVNDVTRADVGEPSEGLGDPVKGAYSDAFKRAAVKHGIGRYLYELGETWVPAGKNGKGKVMPTSATHEAARRFYIDKIGVPAEPDGTPPRPRQEAPEAAEQPEAAQTAAPQASSARSSPAQRARFYTAARRDLGYTGEQVDEVADALAQAKVLRTPIVAELTADELARLLQELRQRRNEAA